MKTMNQFRFRKADCMKLIDCIIRIKAFCFFKIVYSKVIPYKLGLLGPGFNSPGLTDNKKK